MKYIISLILLFIGVFVFASSAHAEADFTRVRGNVYNLVQGGGLGSLTVTVNCLGNVKTATTDSYGLYFVDYSHEECPKFQPVSSSVTYNGQSQSQTVYVADVYRATLDFYYGATDVPEFGAMTGVISAIGSGIAYLGLRRKLP